MPWLEILLADLQQDRERPWILRTSGGLLMFLVLAAILGGVLVDLARMP